VGPRASLDGCGKSCPHCDLIPEPSSPQWVTIPNMLSWPLSLECSLMLYFPLWQILQDSLLIPDFLINSACISLSPRCVTYEYITHLILLHWLPLYYEYLVKCTNHDSLLYVLSPITVRSSNMLLSLLCSHTTPINAPQPSVLTHTQTMLLVFLLMWEIFYPSKTKDKITELFIFQSWKKDCTKYSGLLAIIPHILLSLNFFIIGLSVCCSPSLTNELPHFQKCN